MRSIGAECVEPSNLNAWVFGFDSGLIFLRNVSWEKKEDDLFAEVQGVLCRTHLIDEI